MSDLRKHGTRQDRYAYKKMKTGIEWHKRKGSIFRFLTLSGAGRSGEWRASFDKLRRMIRRKFKKFEYFMVRTLEGAGVLHIVFVGKAMKWSWLKKSWKRATKNKFWNLNISSIKDFLSIGFEMTRQKMTVRYSQSRGWLGNFGQQNITESNK